MDLEHGGTGTLMRPPSLLDYSLTGENSKKAVELGLAEADWYQCPVPRAEMRKLLERKDGPAIRDSIIWFALLLGLGAASVALWGTWWFILPYLAYAAIYASTLRLSLARVKPRHRLQNRLDEQCTLRSRFFHGDARIRRLALEPHPPSFGYHNRRPRS